MDLKYVSFVRYRFVPIRTFNVTKGILKFAGNVSERVRECHFIL